MDLSNYKKLIEDVFTELKIDVEASRGENENQWSLKKGDTRLWIDIFQTPDGSSAFFQCASPILELQEGNNEELFIKLLDLNYLIYGASIAKLNNTIYVKSMIDVNSLSKDFILESIRTVSFFSEKIRNDFNNE